MKCEACGNELPEEPQRASDDPTVRMVWRHCLRTLIHKWWVFVAGRRIGVAFWRLFRHDLSKFSKAERRAYAARFHQPAPASIADAVDVAFVRAWHHHLHSNGHHWQHWLMFGADEVRALEMPKAAVREMVADWAGTGRTIHGRWQLAEWYSQQRDAILLHPATREMVDGLVRRWVRDCEGGAWPAWKSEWDEIPTTAPGTDGTVRVWSPRPAEWIREEVPS